MFKLILFVIIIYSATTSPNVKASNTEPTVKQSSSGICHDSSSSYYNRTKKYTAFNSMNACIAAGGRLSKSKTKSMYKAINKATEQGRDFIALYDRSDWPHWIDRDKDCQNTRHELLLSTSSEEVKYKTAKQCIVFVGSWYDPYSNETYKISRDLDLDHIVPLKFAHGHGGDKWDRELKELFANDIDNLLLVNASLNRQKGAKGPSEWLPPNHQYRCEYITKFNAVMNKYELYYVSSEQRIVSRMMRACK